MRISLLFSFLSFCLLYAASANENVTTVIPTDAPCFNYYFYEINSTNGSSSHDSPEVEMISSVPESELYNFVLVWILMAIGGLLVTWFLEHFGLTLVIPESCGWALWGTLVGICIRYATHEDFERIEELIGFRPEFFSGFILPFIIFEGGWNLGQILPIFSHTVGSSVLYALGGTLISMGTVFGCVYGLALTGHSSLRAVDAMALSIMISATDPVATLSVYGKSNCHILPHTLCLGESILNDAVAIVVFRGVFMFYNEPVNAYNIGKVVWKIALAIFASFGIGLSLALIVSFTIKRTKMDGVSSILIVALFAFVAYRLAEMAELSGVFAIFFYGIFSRYYAWYVMTESGRNAVDYIYIVVKDIVEMFIFVLLGSQLWVWPWKHFNAATIFVCFAGCLAGRFLNIVPLTLILNLKRKKENQITMKMQFLLWWAGLRGAVAYALALSVPPGRDRNEVPPEFCPSICTNETYVYSTQSVSEALEKEYTYHDTYHEIVTTVISVVYLTLFIFGTSTAPVLKLLNLSGDDIQPKGEHLKEVVLRRSKLENLFLTLNRKYLIPAVSTKSGRNVKITESGEESWEEPSRISLENRRVRAEKLLKAEEVVNRGHSFEMHRGRTSEDNRHESQ